MGAVCDAWRTFLSSKTMDRLIRLKGSINWFSKWEYFDVLNFEFECDEASLLKTIRQLLLHEFRQQEFTFRRTDIFDARAWLHVPLNYLVNGLEGFNARTGSEGRRYQDEVLKKHEVPKIRFGIKKSWDVTTSDFSLKHRLKDGRRFAELFFTHPNLDPRFVGNRWVAEGEFAKEATRPEMLEALLLRVEEKATQHHFRIIDRWTLRELNNVPHPCTAS